MNISLIEFLDTKPLFYKKIDYNNIHNAWNIVKQHLNIPYVIHIVGTNGKGSTGRYLASFLYQEQKDVLHYSSPHILKFNERIWINGANSTNKQLDEAHSFLQEILPKDLSKILTYFEYTTLIALVLSNNKDFLILEAGLGGEFDATNVVKNDLSIFTPIGYDHQEFLGDTIEQIATTKLKSCDNCYILAHQPYNQIIQIANDILATKQNIQLVQKNLKLYIDLLPKYLLDNLNLVLNIMTYLGFKQKYYKLPTLFGRYQKISNNITIDVGHNLLATQAIIEELRCKLDKIILVYNSYNDKDYKQILKMLK